MRFETHNFSSECDSVLQSICVTDQDARVLIDPYEVQSLFKHSCAKKSHRARRHLRLSS